MRNRLEKIEAMWVCLFAGSFIFLMVSLLLGDGSFNKNPIFIGLGAIAMLMSFIGLMDNTAQLSKYNTDIFDTDLNNPC